MLAKYMDESRSIPTATSFRTLTVTQMDGRRKQLKDAGQKVSFTHLIAWAIAKAATDEMPVMAQHFAEQDGKPLRVDDGRVQLGIAVDVEKKDGSRTLMVPVIRDAGRLSFAEFKAAFDALIDKARTNTLSADDLVGANITLTNPGGIGTVASVPRLMVGQGTIVATGSIAYPVGLGNVGAQVGAEKVMSMTSTYDHRIIQGAESGRFLKTIEGYLQGENGFYEAVFSSLGATLGPAIEPPQAQLAAPIAAPAGAARAEGDDLELMQAVQAATALVKAFRTHGHLAARLDPLGAVPARRPRARPGHRAPDPGADAPDPVEDPADLRRGREPRGVPAAPARGLHGHDRLRDRAHREPPPAAVAARADRGRRVPHAARARGPAPRAAAADRRRRAGAVPAQGVPRPEAVLDRGPRHDGPDDRRGDRAVGGRRRARSRHRHGPPRAPERARAQPRPPLRDDLRRVRGRREPQRRQGGHRDPAGRHRRRQVPPRVPARLRAAQRRDRARQPRVEPVPPGVRRPGRARRHPRRADEP